MDDRTLIAIASQNKCPIHHCKGIFCPNQLIWDERCKCHIGPEYFLGEQTEELARWFEKKTKKK